MTGTQEPFGGQPVCQPMPKMSAMVHSEAQGGELNGESNLSFNSPRLKGPGCIYQPGTALGNLVPGGGKQRHAPQLSPSWIEIFDKLSKAHGKR